MTIKDMHYDFKKKLNKIDSQTYKNLRIPEIDWVLNEACEMFVKAIAMPRSNSTGLGLESTQRSTEDIRTLVVDTNNVYDIVDNIVPLPSDYWYFARGRVLMDKGECRSKEAVLIPRQHDDIFEESSFHKSSFEWREVNALFRENNIRLFSDGTFTNKKLKLNYIKKIPYMHNAEDFGNGSYNLPSGASLSGFMNCVLPEHTHREITDLAVMITTGELGSPTYNTIKEKIRLNLN